MAEGFGNRKWHVAACYLIVSNKILERGIWVEVDPRAGKIIQSGTADRKGKREENTMYFPTASKGS
jgi:hypothetical protein